MTLLLSNQIVVSINHQTTLCIWCTWLNNHQSSTNSLLFQILWVVDSDSNLLSFLYDYDYDYIVLSMIIRYILYWFINDDECWSNLDYWLVIVIVYWSNYIFKFVIVGDANVGKSCLLHRYTVNISKYRRMMNFQKTTILR